MLHKEDCPPRSFPVTRRTGLLLGIAGAGLLAGGGWRADGLFAQSAEAPRASPAFIAASRFVTNADLDDAPAIERAWQQLCALDAGFAQAVEHLHTAIGQSGAKTMAQWLATPAIHDAALIATARTITGAFYLGYTGDPDSQAPHDNNGFVTFTGALMWRPTIDATIIPTYARGGTDYWVKPPEGTPAPKGPQGNPDWTGSTSSSSKKA